MANSLGIPPGPCCPENNGGDLLPLLLVGVALLAARVVFQAFKNRKGKPQMKNLKNLALVAALIAAVGIVFALKHNQAQPSEPAPETAAESAEASPDDTAPAPVPAALPRLLELGADKCIPCKMMAPILDELRTDFKGQLQVDFIDVWKDENAGAQYGVRVIPLQIFFDAAGQELFRHEGFFAKADILAKWHELGVDLQPKAAP